MDVFFFRTNQANALSWIFPDDPGGRPSQVEIARFSELGTSSMVDRPPLSLPCGIPQRGFAKGEIPQCESLACITA